ADPVLQLVRDAAGVEERGRIQLLVLLRTRDLGKEEAVVPNAGRVEERRNVAALGDQLEAAVDLRVETGQVEVRAEDVGVFELVRGRGRTELALIPRGLLRTQGTGVAAELHLVALPRESRGRVAGRDLSVDLGVPVLKGGEILEVVDRAQIDLRLGIGAPNPQTILDDRAAQLAAVILDLVDPVALIERRLRTAAVVRAGLAQVVAVERQVRLVALVGLEI